MLIAALLATSAHAAPERSTGSLLLGVGARPGADDPSTLRFAARFHVPAVQGDVAGLGVVFPIEIASSGNDGFGFRTSNTAVEAAPSLRLRLAPRAVVRPYLDAGIGIVHRFSKTDTWFGTGTSSRTLPMARSGLGLEIGSVEPGGISIVLEPIGYRHYGLQDDTVDFITFQAGVQSTF